MRRFWLVVLAVVGCSTENDLNRWAGLPGEAVRWDDATKASTVSRHFVASFPLVSFGDGTRSLLVRSAHDTEVTVTQPDPLFGWAAQYSSRFPVPPGLTQVPLEVWDWLDFREMDWRYEPPPRTLVTSAFVVESEHPVEVLALWYPAPDADPAIARLLPIQELGTRYQVAARSDDPSGFALYHVVAVENDTEVHAAPVEEPLLLDAGAMVRITLTPEEVASDRGWLVSSNRPVAVFTGGEEWGCRAGTSWEQLPPVSRWGSETIAIPIEGHSSSDLVLVSDDTTVVELDCGGPRTVLAGQILRVEIVQPTRVVANRPMMALVQSHGQTCDWTAPGPGLVALTPEALHRSQVEVEPVPLEHYARFHEYGAEITTAAAVASTTLVSSEPLLDPLQVSSVDDSLVEVLHVDEASTLAGDPFRGIEYGVAPYGMSEEELYAKFPWWVGVTYVTHLGHDCTDCVVGLADPVVCP